MSVGQYVFVISPHLGTKTTFELFSDNCVFDGEDECVAYKFCWPSPVHSFLGPSNAELVTILYLEARQLQCNCCRENMLVSGAKQRLL
jgi:hypothetical protein